MSGAEESPTPAQKGCEKVEQEDRTRQSGQIDNQEIRCEDYQEGPGETLGRAGSSASAGKAESVEDRASQLRFSIEKSIRYHQRRRAHYEWLHRGLMLLIILGGSTTIAQIFGETGARNLGVAITIVGAIELVFNFSHKSRDHDSLSRQFANLLKDTISEGINDAQLRLWTAERLSIEADEPPIFWAVEAACHNEMCRARSDDPNPPGLVEMAWWVRVPMNWLRFENKFFEPKD